MTQRPRIHFSVSDGDPAATISDSTGVTILDIPEGCLMWDYVKGVWDNLAIYRGVEITADEDFVKTVEEETWK